MSATVDANVLLYASDAASPRHTAARHLVEGLAAGPDLVYLFWPALIAYLRIATHPGVFARPLDPAQVQGNVASLIGRPHVRTPGEGTDFWSRYEEMVEGHSVRGNLVPDAHLAALMRSFGVSTIWTADRDFHRFPGITVRNPFA